MTSSKKTRKGGKKWWGGKNSISGSKKKKNATMVQSAKKTGVGGEGRGEKVPEQLGGLIPVVGKGWGKGRKKTQMKKELCSPTRKHSREDRAVGGERGTSKKKMRKGKFGGETTL